MGASNTYWAAEPDSDAFAQEAARRIGAFCKWYPTSIHGRFAAKAYAYKFGLPWRTEENSLQVARSGVRGELARMRVSHWATHQNLRVTLATQQKPTWQPVPANSDALSQSAAISTSGLLDYHYRQKRVDRLLLSAADKCEWSGAGYTLGLWDMRAGEIVAEDPETAETVHEGDFRFHSLHEGEVARDYSADSWEACDWKAARVPANRWALAAAYPDKRDAILTAPARNGSGDADWLRVAGDSESDQVWVWHFFHEKTPALAVGRYAILLEDEWLEDGALSAREAPIFRCAEGDWEGTPFGFPQIWHGLALQEVIDLLTTAITTNNLAFATQLIAVVKNDVPAYKQLTQALAILEVTKMENLPKGFSLLATPAEAYQFRDKLIQELGIISAINETTLGVVNPNMKSGSMAALYDAAAMRAANALQMAAHRHAEDLGTFIVRTWADNGPDEPKSLAIIGEHNRPLMVSVDKKALQSIDRVNVEIIEASAKSYAAKSAAADSLLQSGALKEQNSVEAQRYMMVQRTGVLDNLTEAPTRNSLRIRQACERLARGERNTIHVGLTHWLDIPEKLGVLSSQEVLDDGNIAEAVVAEVLEHLAKWRMMPPDLLAAMGGPPPPQMGAMPVSPTEPPAPGAPSETGAPTPGAAPSSTLPADMPSQPSQPTLPGAAEPYEPTQGAAA